MYSEINDFNYLFDKEERIAMGRTYGDRELVNVSVEKIPAIIHEQVNRISQLGDAVEQSEAAAIKAHEAAENAQGFESWGPWSVDKKEAIERLQKATISLSSAQGEMASAQKIFFESQKELAEAGRFLFAMGCANSAHNRVLIKELAGTLEGASRSQLTAAAQKELNKILDELKERQAVQDRLNRLDKVVSDEEKQLDTVRKEVEDCISKMKSYNKKLTDHTKQIKTAHEYLDKTFENIESLKNLSTQVASKLTKCTDGQTRTVRQIETLSETVSTYVKENDVRLGEIKAVLNSYDESISCVRESVNVTENRSKKLIEGIESKVSGLQSSCEKLETEREDKEKIVKNLQRLLIGTGTVAILSLGISMYLLFGF